LLRDEFPDLVCVLIGDTSPDDATYRDGIELLIDQLGLRGQMRITGYRADVANYVAALEIQIHASISPEPFGRVLLEGMALGKPLVGSSGGAVPEIVVDGQTGLLFEPGRPEALANALRVLLNDPARAAAMGNAGRQRLAAEFSIQHNVSETQALYDRLLVE
jgi:glycosyltransferase involved in cell wall biosynthesis